MFKADLRSSVDPEFIVVYEETITLPPGYLELHVPSAALYGYVDSVCIAFF